MTKVVLRGYIRVPAGDLEAVTGELDNHVRLTRAEAGCRVFEVVQDTTDRYRFDVYEEFSDQAALERHQARVRRSRWGQVSARVSRHYEIIAAEDE